MPFEAQQLSAKNSQTQLKMPSDRNNCRCMHK